MAHYRSRIETIPPPWAAFAVDPAGDGLFTVKGFWFSSCMCVCVCVYTSTREPSRRRVMGVCLWAMCLGNREGERELLSVLSGDNHTAYPWISCVIKSDVTLWDCRDDWTLVLKKSSKSTVTLLWDGDTTQQCQMTVFGAWGNQGNSITVTRRANMHYPLNMKPCLHRGWFISSNSLVNWIWESVCALLNQTNTMHQGYQTDWEELDLNKEQTWNC